jgi:hypothetical protein
MREYGASQKDRLENLFARTQVSRQRRLPGLMDTPSRHRWCAQKNKTRENTLTGKFSQAVKLTLHRSTCEAWDLLCRPILRGL